MILSIVEIVSYSSIIYMILPYDTTHCDRSKIQQHSFSSINRVPHHHFTYDTALRNLHCERPNGACNHVTCELIHSALVPTMFGVCLRGTDLLIPLEVLASSVLSSESGIDLFSGA
jgi:hypothetical protein